MSELLDDSSNSSSARYHDKPLWRRWPFLLAGGLLLLTAVIYATLFAPLPSGAAIKAYKPESTHQPSAVDWNRIAGPTRIWASLAEISRWLQQAVVHSEDDLFYEHGGVNIEMLREAMSVNLARGAYSRGASTITMQLARNVFLHKRKTLLRKAREIILARRIEQHLSKEQILELYLNIVEWGENIYGAEAASRFYFGKPARALSLSEASLLAGMLPNPRFFNPYKRPENCRRMQKRVLNLMRISRVITNEESKRNQVVSIRLRDGTIMPGTSSPDTLLTSQELDILLEDFGTQLIEDVEIRMDSVVIELPPDTIVNVNSMIDAPDETPMPADSSSVEIK